MRGDIKGGGEPISVSQEDCSGMGSEPEDWVEMGAEWWEGYIRIPESFKFLKFQIPKVSNT